MMTNINEELCTNNDGVWNYITWDDETNKRNICWVPLIGRCTGNTDINQDYDIECSDNNLSVNNNVR